MKRYASHFLFLPEYGYWKQCVVETKEGFVTRIFSLTEEVEDVEWLPGAILLLAHGGDPKIERFPDYFSGNLLKSCPPTLSEDSRYIPIYFSKFDIKTMQPVAGTLHKQLL